MGIFKTIKQARALTKQAEGLRKQQLKDGGYSTGMMGSFKQLGDMAEQASGQLGQLMEDMQDRDRIMAEGEPGTGIVMAMGTPARGAAKYNLDIDMQIHVESREPYRVARQYMVDAGHQLGPGVQLPVRVDRNDPSKVAIDWDQAASNPQRDVVRPAPEAAAAPATPEVDDVDDTLEDLERLVKLRDAGALTDAEFEEQKQRILRGS